MTKRSWVWQPSGGRYRRSYLNSVNGMTFIASSQSAESSSELIFLSSGLMTLEEGSDISYHGEMLGFGSLELLMLSMLTCLLKERFPCVRLIAWSLIIPK